MIKISFKDGNTIEDLDIASSYKGAVTFKDNIKISTNTIAITAYRSKKIDLKSVFYNHTSSMNVQIIKSIIYYYLNSKKFVNIKSIEIKRYRTNLNKPINNIFIKSSEIHQVLSSNFKLLEDIKKDKLVKIFDNDEKGEAILIASSYLTKSLSLTDEIEIFEKLWKAFNKLYKYIGQNKKEFECQVELRRFILDNPLKFPLTIDKVKLFTAKEIRSRLRWRALVLNDYNTEGQTEAFRDFILRYSDKRIMELFKEILPYREEYLKNKDLYNTTLEYIDNNIKQNVTKDEELVTLLCIKYMYFVRNKLMHGEKLDSTFRFLQNKEVEEIKWLNQILQILIVDLVNCNDDF